MKKYLTALLILFSAFVSAGDFHLTESGQPVARILLESTDGEDVSEQIRLFNSCLRKITGTELPVGDNQLPNVIRIAIRSTTRLEEVISPAKLINTALSELVPISCAII